jgi:two-component system CheB/CheR fusion protein
VSVVQQQLQDVQNPLEKSRPTSAQHRLLVVDDHADSRNLLVRLLSRSYKVRAADSYETALEEASGYVPDAVISDIRLSGVDGDGRDGLGLMRELKRLYDVQGIAVSGHALDDETLRDAGFVAYLPKPILFDRLLDTVEAVCAASRLSR